MLKIAGKGHNQQIGYLGESLVAHGLERRGFKLLSRNVRTRYGEIDLIVQKGTRTVFVEVKTRLSKYLGYPEEALTHYKRCNLSRAVLSLLDQYCRGKSWAILVVSVELDLRRRRAVLHSLELDD